MCDECFGAFLIWTVKYECLSWVSCWLAQILIFCLFFFYLSYSTLLFFGFFPCEAVWLYSWQHWLLTTVLMQPYVQQIKTKMLQGSIRIEGSYTVNKGEIDC